MVIVASARTCLVLESLTDTPNSQLQTETDEFGVSRAPVKALLPYLGKQGAWLSESELR